MNMQQKDPRSWLFKRTDLHGKIVMDAGCGSGHFVPKLLSAGAEKVVAVDMDPEAIAEAQASIRLAGLTNRVSFIIGDLSRAGLVQDACADVIVLNYVGPGLDPKDFDEDYRILRNLYRALRPSGQLFLLADSPEERDKGYVPFLEEWHRASCAVDFLIGEYSAGLEVPLTWAMRWLTEIGYAIRESSQGPGEQVDAVWLRGNIDDYLARNIPKLPEVFRESFRSFLQNLRSRIPEDFVCTVSNNYNVWAAKA
jgi:SAM-dependent methyltransferase